MSEYPIDNRPEDVILETDQACLDAVAEVTAFRDAQGFIHQTRQQAIYANATHRVCGECGKKVVEKYRTMCEGCADLATIKSWKEIESREVWDGKAPIYCLLTDCWVFNGDQLEEWFEGHPDTQPCFVKGVQQQWGTVDPEHITEIVDTDGDGEPDLPEGVEELANQINEILKNNPPSWWECPAFRSHTAVDVSRDRG